MRAIAPVWRGILLAGLSPVIAGWLIVSLVWSDQNPPQGLSTQPSAKAAPKASAGQQQPAEKAKQDPGQLKKALEEAQEAEERERREIEQRIRTDPLWQPSHQETAVICPSDKSQPRALNSFCVNVDGNLLAACGGDREEYIQAEKPGEYRVRKVSEPAEIRVLSPRGELLKTWPMAFRPEAICVAADGAIYVGGDGRLAKLDQEGRVLAAAASPAVVRQEPTADPKAAARTGDKQASTPPKESAASDEEAKAVEAALAERTKRVTGIAVTDRDLFLCCPMRKAWSYAVWRTDHNFGQARKIVEGLIGCCGQMDVQAHDGDLWVAHTCRHRVEHYDRDGKKLLSFGKYDRRAADGFGGCCEPKNLRFGPHGDLYTAESMEVVSVKRFTTAGKFLGVVGIPKFNAGCGRTTIDMSRDAAQVYVLDRGGNSIHVLTKRS
jgi:hypothetical protein